MANSNFVLRSPGLSLTFERMDNRLRLLQIRRENDTPLLYRDGKCRTAGAAHIGNPLTVVINDSVHAGIYGIETFIIKKSPTPIHT